MGVELTDRDFRRFAGLVHSKSGIRLHAGKMELLRLRLGKRLRATGCNNFDEYYQYLTFEDDGAELISMVDAITTNKTSFFRERRHFDFLDQRIFPALAALERRRARLRVWSAGCSSGEEPYSIAMTVLEFFRKQLPQEILILATDISRNMLQLAQNGIFPAAQVKVLSITMQRRYFQKGYGLQEGFFRVKENLRNMVVFEHQNLMNPFSFDQPFDLILCRNVMIYFDKTDKNKLVERFYSCLDDGGYLLIGQSESLTGMDHRFAYVEPSIYQR